MRSRDDDVGTARRGPFRRRRCLRAGRDVAALAYPPAPGVPPHGAPADAASTDLAVGTKTGPGPHTEIARESGRWAGATLARSALDCRAGCARPSRAGTETLAGPAGTAANSLIARGAGSGPAATGWRGGRQRGRAVQHDVDRAGGCWRQRQCTRQRPDDDRRSGITPTTIYYGQSFTRRLRETARSAHPRGTQLRPPGCDERGHQLRERARPLRGAQPQGALLRLQPDDD